jgi:DNA-directed RNA polymerase II subunit RPB7
MLNFLESKLYSDVEGTCSGQFGYIIAVVSILDIGKGMVLSGSGQAEFITRYRAIVFKPFKGEVVDGVVNNVNKVSKTATVPDGLLSHLELDGFLCGCWTTYRLCLASSTFWTFRAVQICITNLFAQLIHPDMRFDPNSNPPSFASDEQVI